MTSTSLKGDDKGGMTKGVTQEITQGSHHSQRLQNRDRDKTVSTSSRPLQPPYASTLQLQRFLQALAHQLQPLL